MYAFECSLHALPDSEVLASGETLTDSCGQWPTLLIAQDQLITPLPIVFDDVLNQLNTLPRLYAEPDGSFVWTSPQENIRWQVNGNLYERNDRVLFVELKGSCPTSEFDQLLACFLQDEKACVVQLTRPAVFVTPEIRPPR